ncbi:hypothetical protein SNE40_009426 [Patella caerulea]|uniref:Uncharacterized protein n=1 Tax=Patella caerulea TaxID=87958 RepID=A0AAN8PR87_PATCE
MLRIILITTLVLFTNAQIKTIGPVLPVCRIEPLVLADPLKINSDDALKSAPLTDEMATKMLESVATAEAAPSLRAKRQANEAALARTELENATGSILASPTQLKLNNNPCQYPASNSFVVKDVCPHRKELLTSFYSGGFCRVIFPYWQRKYQTRCLCNECVTGCKPINGRRNLCRPTKRTTHRVWAFCRVHFIWGWTWQIKKVTVSLADGDCDCKSYRSRC